MLFKVYAKLVHWSNIDLEKGILQVRHTLTWVHGMGYVEGEPKTKAGRRKIALPIVVVDGLREHKVRQEQVRIKKGEKWQEHELVFCNIHGGYFNPGYVWRLFKKMLKKAGLPDVRFHDLRHGAATVLLAAKVDLKVVQEVVRRMDDLYGRSPSSMREP